MLDHIEFADGVGQRSVRVEIQLNIEAAQEAPIASEAAIKTALLNTTSEEP